MESRTSTPRAGPARRLSGIRSAGLRALRTVGLLKSAETLRFWTSRARSFRRNRRFRRTHPAFAVPPAHLVYDACARVDWQAYRDLGRMHASVFAHIILEETDAVPLDILEWGCGPGRLIRHLPDMLPERTVTLTGTDYNPETISWCRDNLSGIKFDTNGLMPPVPLADDSFDVVYNFSVFTHLSEETQKAWAAELRRVMKPGGLLICTTQGDRYRFLIGSRSELQRYDLGQVVVQGRYAEGRKWFLAFHPPGFVHEVLLKDFRDVRQVRTTTDDHMFQDVWTARK